MSKDNILITGAGGFLGSHLAERFLKEGHEVWALDNFSTGSRENFALLSKDFPDTFHPYELDVVAPWDFSRDWPKAFSNVFHFASPASPPLYQALALETMWVNSIGLSHALEFAQERGAKLVFASTSEIYGDPEVHPQPESYRGCVNSYGPRSCYDEAKRFGESLIWSFNKKHISKHGLVRIFNTYGPRMNPKDGRVLINFLVQLLEKKPLTVFGEGKQTRSFCYVDDLIEGIYRYAKSELSQPVNLGNPNEMSILDLAQTVQKLSNSGPIPIEHLTLPEDDPTRRKPDISLALEKLQWKPQVGLEQGLGRMLDWLKTIK